MVTTIYGTPTAAPIPGAQFGTGANKAVFSSGGVLTLEGDAKRILTIRPALQFSELIRIGASVELKPTPCEYGAFTGFSMPIYNSDNEELFFKMRVPFRWDGASDPVFKMIVALGGAEDVGDKFKFQLSWMNTSVTAIATDVTIDTTTETTVIADHTAQYSCYSVSFNIDWDGPSALEPARTNVTARDLIAGRLRRIAASGSEVSNEIMIADWAVTYTVDKMFGAPT